MKRLLKRIFSIILSKDVVLGVFSEEFDNGLCGTHKKSIQAPPFNWKINGNVLWFIGGIQWCLSRKKIWRGSGGYCVKILVHKFGTCLIVFTYWTHFSHKLTKVYVHTMTPTNLTKDRAKIQSIFLPVDMVELKLVIKTLKLEN